jgi:glycosyltransferase involved in cell wall biosynthesis
VTPSRISYVIGTTAGGTGRHAEMLARGCAERRLVVSVFGPAAARRLFPAVTFTAVDIAERPRPARDAASVLRLRRLLARQAPEVVHAHGQRAGALTVLALAGTSRRQCPATVVTVHNAVPPGVISGAVYRVLERLTAQRAGAVLCVSPDLADRVRRAGARDIALAVVPAPTAALPSPGDVIRARADMGAAGRPIVLAAGRLAPQKGFDVLLEAMITLQHRDPAPLLVIAGEGPLAGQLAGRSRAAGTDVRFLGQRSDIPALLAAADVVAVPSRWEGQPLIVQEALRAGRPLVASRVGGIPDLTGEDAALLVPPGDPGPLASAVLALLDDQAMTRALGAAALARARTLPSESDAVDAALAVYGRLAPRPAGRQIDGAGMTGRGARRGTPEPG